jgi:hypothetical protein
MCVLNRRGFARVSYVMPVTADCAIFSARSVQRGDRPFIRGIRPTALSLLRLIAPSPPSNCTECGSVYVQLCRRGNTELSRPTCVDTVSDDHGLDVSTGTSMRHAPRFLIAVAWRFP